MEIMMRLLKHHDYTIRIVHKIQAQDKNLSRICSF